MLYFLGNKYYDLTLKFVQIYEFLSIKVYFFIIFSCFILQTAAFAQNNVKITIKKKNITLQEALRELRNNLII